MQTRRMICTVQAARNAARDRTYLRVISASLRHCQLPHPTGDLNLHETILHGMHVPLGNATTAGIGRILRPI
jgi:hypothetical protein